MGSVAQGYWLYQNTGSAKILGLVAAMSSIPIIAFGLLGGTIADRFNRKRLLQIAQTSFCLLAVLVAVFITTGQLIWQHFLVIAFLQGVLWAFNGPARQALIPQLVGRGLTGNAIALTSSGMSIASLLSPALAGFLYSVAHADGVYYFVAGMAATAGVFTTAVKVPAQRRDLQTASKFTEDLARGISYLWSNKFVRNLMLAGFIFMFLSWPVQFLLPKFVVDTYHREAGALGLLMTMSGIGSLMGTLIIASLGRGNRGKMFLGAVLCSCLGLILMGWFPSYYAALGFMILVGIGNAGTWSLSQILVMENVDESYRGRAMSVFMMNFGLMPIVVVPAGILADLWGPGIVVGISGGILLIILAIITLTQQSIREAL